MMGYVSTAEGYRFHGKMLDEYRDDATFRSILEKVLEDTKQQLEAKGFKTEVVH
jgi:hypothetical protein